MLQSGAEKSKGFEHKKGPGETLTARGIFPPRRAYNPLPMNPPPFPDMPPSRPVVVVLGSGRSGTSLLMQVLAALGMRVSEDLIQARRDNPEGFLEDAPIVRAQADLLRALGAWPYHPLPTDWLERPVTVATRRVLAGLLPQRLAGQGIWGFKDPRTAAFLPLWQALFAEEGISPKYILALREPGKIIRSFMQAYGTPEDVAEAVWLRRTCDALWHTRADCHIAHYEDWFSRPREAAEGLARHTGLAAADIDGALAGIVRPDLDRAGGGDEALRDPHALALHTALKNCRGSGFDREGLLEIVAECRASSVESAKEKGHAP